MGRDALPFGSADEAQTPPASAPQPDTGSDQIRRLLERQLAQQRALAEFARRALRASALETVLAEGAGLLQRFPASSAPFEKPEAYAEYLAFVDALTDVVEAASGRFRADEETRRAALHDALTGLATRTLIIDHLELALKRARRQSTLAAIIFVDVDHFKGVNDTFGHLAGDDLLVGVAERLHGAVRPADTVGRWGGDEFVAVCDELHADDVPVLVERIAAAFDRPFGVQGMDLSVTVSIGVAVSGGVGDPATLIAEADSEMYRSKRLHGPPTPERAVSPGPGGDSPTVQERLTLRLLELLSDLGGGEAPLVPSAGPVGGVSPARARRPRPWWPNRVP